MTAEPLRSVREELPAQAAWMRRLARSLTRDEASADDVAQDAWVAALEHGPERERTPRSWLARVAVNFASKGWRDRSSREHLERSIARPESTPAADDVVARLDLQRALADELRALREPYRTTLLRRYFDGWSSARIAREQGVPAATVRTRVQHGLAELRSRLDRRCGGDRSAWRFALLPLTFRRWPRWLGELEPTKPLTAAHGVLAMKGVLQLGLVGAVALAVGVGAWWGFDVPQASAPSAVEEHEPREVGGLAQPTVEAADVRAATSEARASIDAGAAAEPTAPVAEALAPTRVDARCIDADARPVAGARLTIAGFDEPAAFSGADGRVTLELPDGGRNTFTVQAATLATAFVDAHYARGATTHLGDLVLGAAGAVRGRVVDVDGVGVAGARVTIAAADSWTRDVESAKRRGPHISTGAANAPTRADGSFLVEGVPPGGARAWGAIAGMRFALSEPLTIRENEVTDGVVLVIEPLQPEDEISGVVLAPDGAPVPNAMLGLRVVQSGTTNVYSTPVDENGRFQFRLLAGAKHDITASDPEHRWQDAHVAAVAPGARDVEVRFAENRYVEVSVRASSKPVTRFALVSLRADGKEQHEPVIERSDGGIHESGRARIRVPTRRFSIQVAAPGYALEQRGPFEPDAAPASLDFELAPEEGISGRITAGGTALAGAKVTLWKTASAHQEVEVDGYPSLVEPCAADEFTTGDDGEYFLRVRAGGRFVVRAEHDAYAPSEHGPFAAQPAARVANVDLALGPGGTIAGRVLAPPGRSSEGVLISINHGDAHARTARSDERGEFRFERVMVGSWHVSRGKREIGEQRGQSWSIGSARRATEIPFNCEVHEGRTTDVDVDLRDFEPCKLKGRLALNGAPARGWTLQVWPGDASTVSGELPSASTDERGEFEVVVEEPGKAHLSFSPPTELGEQGQFSVYTELQRGANEWNGDWSVARIDGRAPVAASEDELLYYVVRGMDLTCILVVRPDANGDFVLPYVPAGPGEFSRLEHHPDERVSWIPVTRVEVARGESKRVELP